MSRCRSCDAEVVFVSSATSGKPMILNAEPSKGVVVLPVRLLGREVTNRPPEGQSGEGPWASVLDVYTDHHATRPKAAEWKGKRR